MDPLKHVGDLFRFIQKNKNNPTAFNDFEEGKWVGLSTEQFVHEVKMLTLALVRLGVKKGDRVGILALPCARWTVADFAIMFAGGITIPLFANISEENFVFECSQTNLNVIFVGGEAQWQMYSRNKNMFQTAISLDPNGGQNGAVIYAEALKMGESTAEKEPRKFDELESQMRGEDVATIIYTSGSTGIPKGVELTQINICATLHDGRISWRWQKDRYLSVLPLAHVFGHMINLFAVYWGISIYYFNDYKKMAEACRQVHPTVMVVVPRILEKVYAKFLAGVQESSWLKRKIGLWAISFATRQQVHSKSSLKYKIADKLVYSKFRHALGGELRVLVSGGAATPIELLYFFQNIGMPILQGWGMTEACPAACNSFERNKFGTVGKALSGQEIKIGPEGEILVKGSLVMKGYYLNPESTAATIDKDHWLHTGDKGSIDEAGYLTIIGRLKELYKTSTGEYVAPVPIEQALSTNPLIEMAMVIADGRKFVSALFFPNSDQLQHLKRQYGQQNLNDADFLGSWAVRKEMEKHINNVNQHLNHWEQIHDYRFITEPLTIENGDLTPSMKIRRDPVANKYRHLIEEIYHQSEQS